MRISSEYFFAIAMLLAYALAGGFAILPFRKSLRFGLLAAPLAGILCVSLGMAVFYGIAGFPAQQAMHISCIACAATTVLALIITRPKIPWRDLPGLLLVFAVTVPFITRITDVASIREHGPAFHYADATDQIGYAQAADWLRMHPVSVAPSATPENPYNAWLTVLFQIDPRFGSHFYLATISIVRGVSAAFSYDIATAIALAAALLAVAGVFAQKWESLLILLLGLLVCHWYEDTRLGYLGKLLGYPSMLLVVGLFMALPRKPTVESIVALALLASATAIVHSAMATALFLTTLCGIYLVFRPLLARPGERGPEWESTWHKGLALALLVGTAVMSSGLPARPVSVGPPDFSVTWRYILPRTLDLEHQGANIGNFPNDHRPPLAFGREHLLVSGLKARTVRTLAWISSAIWVLFLFFAIGRRDAQAVGMLLGPLVLLLTLYFADKRPETFQLVGVIYPATLCGIARLINFPTRGERPDLARLSFVACIVTLAFIGLRVPRFAGSVNRYAGAQRPRSQEFSLAQTKRIIDAVGNEPVELNMPSLTHLLFAMVELHNNGVHVQFSPGSYAGAFSYMGWSAPNYPPPKFQLALLNTPRPPGWRVKLRAAPYMLLVPE